MVTSIEVMPHEQCPVKCAECGSQCGLLKEHEGELHQCMNPDCKVESWTSDQQPVQPVTIPVESLNSVKIAINAKGLFSGEVKVYAPDIDEAYDKALAKAKVLESLILDKNGLIKK